VDVRPGSLDRALEALADRPVPAWDVRRHYLGSPDRVLRYLLVLDTINFSFWGGTAGGYNQLAERLRDLFREGDELAEEARLAHVTAERLRELLGDLPMLGERAAALRELGRNGFAGLVQASAAETASALAGRLSSYRDVAVYQGREVPLLKRAQILPADLHGAGVASFADLADLTCFPDYKLPQLLRHLGAIVYSEGLARRVDDWRELVTSPDVQIVDVCTPPGTHAEIAAAAAAAGRAVICEKPLAVTYAQAAGAAGAVRRAGVLNAVGFNYRRLPAVSLMKRMVDEGAVGEVRLWRGTWLSDEFVDPSIPFDWRFDRAVGGSTIADLGSHLIDMALWMVGDVAEVTAQSETFVRRRSDPTGGTLDVSVDDASSALLRFESGARGVLEVARAAVRRPCDFMIEVNGDAGTLAFEYARLNELLYGQGSDSPALYGMRRIRAEHESHPYARSWWPIGQGVGYGASFVNHLGDLLERWPAGPWEPDFGQGAAVQAVCEAIERAAAERRWVSVAEILLDGV